MTGFEERLRALRRRFIECVSMDADEIEKQASALHWRAVRDLSHGIVGRAGMFGFSELSDTAKLLEDAIEEGVTPDHLRRLSSTLVSSLRRLDESQ